MTAELRALNARFINNFITNDVPGHDAILHKDFICITPMGARVSRADYLKAWATGFDAGRIPYYDYRDEKIDVFGDTALVRSTNKRVGLMLNVRKENLAAVLGVLPALQKPTISHLSDEDWLAVNTVIDESAAWEVIPRLKEAHATGIVEYPLNKVVL